MSNSLKRFFIHQSKWTDKTAPRHKHDFSIESCVELHKPRNSVYYYHVMKCRHCNSFKGIPREHAIDGYCSSRIEDLPLIKMKSPHSMIGFEDAVLEER